MSELEFSGDAEKLELLNKTELDEVDRAFSLNALRVLASRYLIRDAQGKIIESPKHLFTRIATLIGLSDVMHDTYWFDKKPNYGCSLSEDDIYSTAARYEGLKIGDYELNIYHREAIARLWWANKEHFCFSLSQILDMIGEGRADKYATNIKEYYDLMVSKDFLPNTPTLMNAGAKLGQLSACFVLGIEDNLESIMDTARDTAFIFKSGGGVGINYSHLRAENSMVASTSGVASGPVSFMELIDSVTGVIKQGGKRRGANMGILNVDHPDIKNFITRKRTPGKLENFNVSVGTDEKFWQNLNGFPETEEDKKKAQDLFNLIAESAWASAEPGLIFFDKINKYNPLEKARGYRLEATNPCGEQSLYPYESCNLGSINLANFVDETGWFDTERYIQRVRLCTRFLDNVVSMNKYPLKQNETAGLETRRIGLGVMGLSDALIKMRIRYDSPRGFSVMGRLAELLTFYSMRESINLAKERGPFPLFRKSSYLDGIIPVAGAYEDGGREAWKSLIDNIKEYGIRNSFCTTVAPTGSLSMIADTSSGIEPTFALAYEKRIAAKAGAQGNRYFYKNKYLKEFLEKGGNDVDEIWKNISENHGSCQNSPIGPEMKDVFVTTFDISPLAHIMAQAVWQKWINNAISKTINLPKDATVDDIKKAYLFAHENGLKGITVYRDGSRKEQVLHA